MPEATRIAAGVAVSIAMLVATGCGLVLDRDPDPVVVTVTSAAPDEVVATPSVSPSESPAVAPGVAPDVRIVEHAGHRYEVVTLPLDTWDVRVDWAQSERGTFLAEVVADPLVAVATNAGIFTPSISPGGLLVSDGEVLRALNLADGAGNFHLMPNGVFEIRDDGTAAVVGSTAYDAAGVVFATQSGPALVLGGVIHPEFVEESTNLAFRSGVGVSTDGSTVYLVLSWSLTNFYDFATLFTDELGCDDALYLDGNVSRMWVQGQGEPDPFAGRYAGVITARLSAGTGTS